MTDSVRFVVSWGEKARSADLLRATYFAGNEMRFRLEMVLLSVAVFCDYSVRKQSSWTWPKITFEGHESARLTEIVVKNGEEVRSVGFT